MNETFSAAEDLPDYYADDSPYQPLVKDKLSRLRARLPEALDPKSVGDLFVEIANSDGSRLRWSADTVAEKVLGTIFGLDDAKRDQFLQDVSGTLWWSQGKEAPK